MPQWDVTKDFERRLYAPGVAIQRQWNKLTIEE